MMKNMTQRLDKRYRRVIHHTKNIEVFNMMKYQTCNVECNNFRGSLLVPGYCVFRGATIIACRSLLHRVIHRQIGTVNSMSIVDILPTVCWRWVTRRRTAESVSLCVCILARSYGQIPGS